MSLHDKVFLLFLPSMEQDRDGNEALQSATTSEVRLQKGKHSRPGDATTLLDYQSDELDVFDLELQKEFTDAFHRQSFPEDHASKDADLSPSTGKGVREGPGVLEAPIAPVVLDTEMQSVAEELKMSEMARDPRFSRSLVKEMAAVVRRYCQETTIECYSRSGNSATDCEGIDGPCVDAAVETSIVASPSFPSQVKVQSTGSITVASGGGLCRDGRKEFEEDLCLVWHVLKEVCHGAQAPGATPSFPISATAAPTDARSNARGSPMTVSLLEQHERLIGVAEGGGSSGVFLKESVTSAPCVLIKSDGRNSIDTEVSDSLSRLQVFSSLSAGWGTDPLTNTSPSSTSTNRGGVGIAGLCDNRNRGIAGGVQVFDPKRQITILTSAQTASEVDKNVWDFRRRPANPYIGCTHGSFTTPGEAPQTEMPSDKMSGKNVPFSHVNYNNHSFDFSQYQSCGLGNTSRLNEVTTTTNASRTEGVVPDSLGGEKGNGGTHCISSQRVAEPPTETELKGKPEGTVPVARETQGVVADGFLCSHTSLWPTVPFSTGSSSSFVVGSGCSGRILCGEEDSSRARSQLPRVERPRPLKPVTLQHWGGAAEGDSQRMEGCTCEEKNGILGGGVGRGPRSVTEKNICPSNYSAFSECSTVVDSRSPHSTEQTLKTLGEVVSSLQNRS